VEEKGQETRRWRVGDTRRHIIVRVRILYDLYILKLCEFRHFLH